MLKLAQERITPYINAWLAVFEKDPRKENFNQQAELLSN